MNQFYAPLDSTLAQALGQMAWAARAVESIGLRVCEALDADFAPGQQIGPSAKAAKKAVAGTADPDELAAVEWLEELLGSLAMRNQILHSHVAGWADDSGAVTQLTFQNIHRAKYQPSPGKSAWRFYPIDTPLTVAALEEVRAEYERIGDAGVLVDVHLALRRQYRAVSRPSGVPRE